MEKKYKMRVLNLTLKKKWFDMILNNEKKEEYREIKRYWKERLQVNGYHRFEFKSFDLVHFTNGYGKHRPQMLVEFKGVEIREGKSEWGAVPGAKYFVIKLGNVLETRNVKDVPDYLKLNKVA